MKRKKPVIPKSIQCYEEPFLLVPGEVSLNPDLTRLDLLVFWLVSMLDGVEHCFASNEYLARKLAAHPMSISKSINKLVRLGYFRTELFKASRGKKNITSRTVQVDRQYQQRYEDLVNKYRNA